MSVTDIDTGSTTASTNKIMSNGALFLIGIFGLAAGIALAYFAATTTVEIQQYVLLISASVLGGVGFFCLAEFITRPNVRIQTSPQNLAPAENNYLISNIENAGAIIFAMDRGGRIISSTDESILTTGQLCSASLAQGADAINPALMNIGEQVMVRAVRIDGCAVTVFLRLILSEGSKEPVAHGIMTEIGADNTIEESGIMRVMRAAPMGLLILDKDGEIIEFNAAAKALNANLANGARLEHFVADTDAAAVSERVSEAANMRSMAPIEVNLNQNENVDAIYAWLSVSRIETPKAPRLVAYLLDSTQRRSLQEQFAQSQKMQAVGQLAGGIAHDFNNLLTAIIGHCDLLLMRHAAGDPSFDDLTHIQQNSNRAAGLVKQLLAFSRRQIMAPTVLTLSELLSEVSHLLNRLLGEKIELDLRHGRDLWQVRADQGQLEQVIVNLAVNARDAMLEGGQSGGKLSITTRNVMAIEIENLPTGATEQDYIIIEVKDQGKGIAPENLSQIFEPFFTTKKVGEGTGLGLATVYGVVQQMGGFITVESVVGEGTVFNIHLPRYKEGDVPIEAESQSKNADENAVSTPVSAASDEAPQDLSGKGSIMLVEDEAIDGEEALELFEDPELQVDLLVTDVVMPNLDGPTMVKKVHESRPDLKVIFISGYSEEAFLEEHDGSDLYNFLPKPFTLKKLAAAVKEVME